MPKSWRIHQENQHSLSLAFMYPFSQGEEAEGRRRLQDAEDCGIADYNVGAQDL
jgi:hypothetical protein